MRLTPRLLPSGLEPAERRAYLAVTAYFVVTLAALVWPVYPRFAGIRPVVLGMPFSLYYVVVWLLGSFTVLLGLFVWEGRRRDSGGHGGVPPEGRERGRGAGNQPPDSRVGGGER